MEYKILQLNDDLKVVKEWNSVKEIAESPEFKKQRTSFDQALRKKMKAHGFYFAFKHEFSRKGFRIDLDKQKRNKVIYAYLPQLGKKLEARETPIINGYTFISAYKNAVIASNDLNVSVSNIRCVCNGSKVLHKGYYFSYEPKNIEDEALGLIQIIERRLTDGDGDYEYWEKELIKAKRNVEEIFKTE